MKNSVLTIFFALFTFLFTKSEVPFKLDTTQFHKKMRSLIENPLLINTTHPTTASNFIWRDTVAYFNPPGTFHLFAIKKQNEELVIKRLDQWNFHGNSFGNQFFFWNGNLYSFGGSGFHNYFFEMMEYNFEEEEWNHHKINNLPIYKSKFLWGWYFEDNFYCFYRQPLPTEGQIIKFGKIDLNNWMFSEIKELKDANHDLEEVMEIKTILDESDNFSIFIYDNQLKVFNKKTGIEGDFPHETTLRLNYPFQPRLKGDTLYYMIQSKKDWQKVDLNTKKLKSEKMMFSFYPNYTVAEAKSNNWYYSLLLLLIPLVLIPFRKKKNMQPEVDEQMQKLAPYFGKEITREELDKALGIDYKSVDSSKTMRSRIVNDINKKKPNTINRVANPKDKRSYLYKIKNPN